MEKDTIATYKIVLVGDTSVGKTHLLKRYSKNELPKNSAPTIGVEFGTKEVTLKDGTKVKAQIWDTEIYNQKKKNPQPLLPSNNIKDLSGTQRQNDDCAC
ncbi:hypothetical protein ABPG72_001216 [Tetrahymena utriculariae]